MSNGESVRHPLGLPPGSVRGLLSLLIIIQLWILLLLPDSRRVPVPMNLYLLLTLVAMFFVSHGKSIASGSEKTPSPLYLPGGTLRFVIIGGTAALIGYLYANHPERLTERLRPELGDFSMWPTLIGSYMGGFTLGYLFRHLPFRNNWMFQSLTAWLALLSLALLFVEIVIRGLVQSSMKEQLDLKTWEAVVTGITAFYFGARS